MVSEPFRGLVASFAASLGIDGYHSVAVPHPLATRDDAQLKEIAIRVTEEAASQLVGT